MTAKEKVVYAVIAIFAVVSCCFISYNYAFTRAEQIEGARADAAIEAAQIEEQAYKDNNAELLSKNAELSSLNEELKSSAYYYKEQYEQLEADAKDYLALSEEERKALVELAVKQKEEAEAAEEALRIEEEKKGYDTGIEYDNLARYPDVYNGKKVKFNCRVLQVVEETAARLATDESGYDDVIYAAGISGKLDGRLLEGDEITVYGTADGLVTYTTVLGAEVTIPQIKVDMIELNE